MEQKNLVPKRRFKEFQNAPAWEKRKLGEVIEGLYNGQTPSRFRDDFWNGSINWLSSGDLNRSIVKTASEKITEAGRASANLRVVPKNTFVMAITGLEAAGTRGNCGILGIDTTLNQSCMAVYPNKNLLSTQFLFQWYRMVGEEYGTRFTQGTKQQSYNAEIIKDLDICLPKKEEQVKISQLLSELDNLITLHQRKLEKTKALKSAYLSEMFPAEGERVPKRRFAGFTQPWERRALRQLGKVYTGNTPPTSDKDNWTDDENGHVWITPTDINSLVMFDSERHLSDRGWSKARIIPEKSVLITSIASIGKNAINTVPVAFNQQINAIVPEKNDAYFILTAMEKETPRFASLAGQTATVMINKTEFENFTLAVPIFDEQKKIGGFFKELDHLITLHQRKLEKLQNLKKAYLNEMFV
ncbi:restriction endonuclease subunit S [Heyndrickxia coagulans]|uniref:restriction endonuclease subunit S n=1 Tax=Heyndrickxia coagulans TaxID=1398 RepID=UPI002E1FA24B|nr:restriction endonuclease subunit S [Heyndrickxia coagulans]MED4346287.1 restriction endonuclease subunit S [Heyndrickxia coagulans]